MTQTPLGEEIDRLNAELAKHAAVPVSAEALAELIAALERSRIAIDDWLNIYAWDQCDPKRVAEARARVNEYGTLAYIADVQHQNRAALAKVRP